MQYTIDEYFSAKCAHTPADPKNENVTVTTCCTTGSHDEVVYCSVCNAELSRETITVPATGKHSWNEGEVTKEPTYTEEGIKTYTCTVCGETKTETIEKLEKVYQQGYNKTIYQIGLIEPWVLRINVRLSNAEFTTIDYSKVINYGVYAIRRSNLSDPNAEVKDLTIEDMMNEAEVIHFAKGNGAEITKNDAGVDTYVAITFTEGLYTYRLAEDVVWVAYYETEDGLFATAVQERNLYDLMDERKDSTSATYSAAEKKVYADMVELYNKVTAYRSEFDVLPEVELQNTATLNSTNIQFGEKVTDGKYNFARLQQISLIEPWGLKLNTRVYTADNTEGNIDYSLLTDYGVIAFYDKDGVIAGERTHSTAGAVEAPEMDEYSELLNYANRDEVYVFSASEGTMTVDGKYAGGLFNKDIFTYQMNSAMYYVFFVQDGDNFYYSQVYATNIRDLAEARSVSTSTTYKETEKATYAAMVALCDSITAYREWYFSQNG